MTDEPKQPDDEAEEPSEDEYPLRAKRKATALEERAQREGWATEPKVKRAIIKKTQIRALNSTGRESERATRTLLKGEELELQKRKLELEEKKADLGMTDGVNVLVNNDNRQVHISCDDTAAKAIIAEIDKLASECEADEGSAVVDDAADDA